MAELIALPEHCYVFLENMPPGRRIGMVMRNESGYWPTGYDMPGNTENDAKRMVRNLNDKIGVTPHQAECMLSGSMFGWDCKAADPNQSRFFGDMEPDEFKPQMHEVPHLRPSSVHA